MKKSHFLTLVGVAVAGLVLAGSAGTAHATPTSLTFFSDKQTYVISGSDVSPRGTNRVSCTNGDCVYADTSYYGKGAMQISAAVAGGPFLDDEGNIVTLAPRAMQSLFSFNTATNVTGTAGGSAYLPPDGMGTIGVDIKSAFNSAYGAGNWSIASVSILLASNWQGQGVQPNNPDFNKVNAGQFALEVLGADPVYAAHTSTTELGTTWNYVQGFLATTTATSVGTFDWVPWPKGTTNNSAEPQWTYNLTVTPELIDAIMSGEFSLLGVAADNGVGYVFNTSNRLAPEIIITADVNSPAPVPVPAAAWLFGPGIAGIAFLRRKVFGA
jgi:hypothetical protein